jgi:short-subunit dehydrogenase
MTTDASATRARYRGVRGLVTGASSGLGRALTEELARAGAGVIATGRSVERLDALVRELEGQGVEPGRVVAVPADLTDAAERRRLFEEVARRFDGALDLLVQSAGVGAYGRFMSHEPSVLRRIFEINFFALAETTRTAYPLLCAGRNPALVVIGSIIARRGLPGRSEYSASKHAVAGLMEAIRAEWTRDGIHVLMVNPGFTRTEFEKNLLVDTAIYKVADRRTMPASTVARRTLRALDRRKNEVTFSLPGRALLAFNRLLPRFVDWGLGRWTRKLYADNLALEAAESPARRPPGEPERPVVSGPSPE